MVEVRVAATTDAKDILEIYKAYIVTTAFSFETEVPTEVQFAKRIGKCIEKFPWIVCTVNNFIAGYVYASPHREREAYQWTCECSVYVADDFKEKGIGSELYAALFEILKLQGYRNVYAGITLPNDASIKLHKKCGFEFFALYENIGYKLGKWQKVGWCRLQLNNYDLKPAPPIKFSNVDYQLMLKVFQKAAENINTKIIG